MRSSEPVGCMLLSRLHLQGVSENKGLLANMLDVSLKQRADVAVA